MYWNLYFCTGTYIFVLELIFLYWKIYFCTGTYIFVLEYIFLYWNLYFCTGTYIFVLEYIFLYWNLYFCIALVGHRRDGSSQGTTTCLTNEELSHMEETYRREVQDYQSLLAIYKIENELARKRGKLKRFPNLTDWRPEGISHSLSIAHLSILNGLQPAAVVYQQHLVTAKEHSRDYLYVSSQHPSKRPTIFFYRSPSEGGSTHKRFGIVKQIFKHSFAEKEFMWVTASFYREPKLDDSCGLWCSKDSTRPVVPVLLSHLSHPLTTAVDEDCNIWFLDSYY